MKKTILITGGAGFVGHHCVEHVLKNTDWNIVILDALTYAGDLNRIHSMEVFDDNRIEFFWHDLRSPINHNFKIDYCIHFAAESHVDRSLQDSIPFAQSNVVGTANLLEYLRSTNPNCKTLIFSTDEVFGAAPERVYFKENDQLKPSNPYAASKVGEEAMAYSFAHAFDLPIIIARCTNVIGELQHPEKFVPKTIKAILNYETVLLHGRNFDDMSSRCWIHARNVADACLFLLNNGKIKEYYNIAGEEQTVLKMTQWISEEIGISGDKVKFEFLDYHKARPGHDKRYALDGSKLAKLGWKSPVNLENSLKKTVKWTLKYDPNFKNKSIKKDDILKSNCCNAEIRFMEKKRYKTPDATITFSGGIICSKCRKKCESDGLAELPIKFIK
jgi:dTDP-glucose 4,6-dehydratase